MTQQDTQQNADNRMSRRRALGFLGVTSASLAYAFFSGSDQNPSVDIETSKFRRKLPDILSRLDELEDIADVEHHPSRNSSQMIVMVSDGHFGGLTSEQLKIIGLTPAEAEEGFKSQLLLLDLTTKLLGVDQIFCDGITEELALAKQNDIKALRAYTMFENARAQPNQTDEQKATLQKIDKKNGFSEQAGIYAKIRDEVKSKVALSLAYQEGVTLRGLESNRELKAMLKYVAENPAALADKEPLKTMISRRDQIITDAYLKLPETSEISFLFYLIF
jgi:hypothetical protein